MSVLISTFQYEGSTKRTQGPSPEVHFGQFGCILFGVEGWSTLGVDDRYLDNWYIRCGNFLVVTEWIRREMCDVYILFEGRFATTVATLVCPTP